MHIGTIDLNKLRGIGDKAAHEAKAREKQAEQDLAEDRK
jgi:hypothetical protein